MKRIDVTSRAYNWSWHLKVVNREEYIFACADDMSQETFYERMDVYVKPGMKVNWFWFPTKLEMEEMFTHYKLCYGLRDTGQ